MRKVLVTFGMLMLVCAAAAPGQSPAVVIDTVAGSGSSGDGTAATSAILAQPSGVVIDTAGDLYVSESGAHRIRKITRAGVISTIAGTGVAGFSGDGGPAASAQLNSPYGLAADLSGNLYVADLGNARIRKITPTGAISTIAGGGALTPGGVNEGAPATSITLTSPRNLVVDDSGVVYFSDFGGQRVFQLAANGKLTTIAGTGVAGSAGDAGAATSAQVAFPAGIAIDSQSALYLADSQNGSVRKIANGVITTLLHGTTPTGVAVAVDGSLWVADPGAKTLTRYPTGGTPEVLSFTAGDIERETDLAFYATDGVAGTVWRVAWDESSSAIVAGGGMTAQGDGGPATAAILNHPASVAADSTGAYYIADRDNNRIRKVGIDGVISTLNITGLSQPSGVSVDSAGNLWIADSGNSRVISVSSAGTVTPLAAGTLTTPAAAVADASGNVYVADFGAGNIIKVTAQGVATTLLSKLAGPRGLALSPDQGSLIFSEESGARVSEINLGNGNVTALNAGAWNTPRGLSVNSSGQVFVADTGREEVLEGSLASPSSFTPVAGNGQAGFSGDGGSSLSAQLNFPWATALTAQGDLLIADLENNRIRRVKGAGAAGSSGNAGGSGSSSGSGASGSSGGAGSAGNLTSLRIINGASLIAGSVAPGELLSIQGSGVAAAAMASTAVLINSIPTPIVSMSDTEIRVTAPITLDTALPAHVTVISNGTIAAASDVSATAAAPGLFAPTNTPSNPAARGSTVSLFGTGLGLGDLSVSVGMAGVAATVVALDPAPGYPGLFRVDVQIPTSIPAGPASVTMVVGGATSQTGVCIYIYIYTDHHSQNFH